MINKDIMNNLVYNFADKLYFAAIDYKSNPSKELFITTNAWLVATARLIKQICTKCKGDPIPYTYNTISTTENYYKTLGMELNSNGLYNKARGVLEVCSYMYLTEAGMSKVIKFVAPENTDQYSTTESLLKNRYSKGIGKILNMISIKSDHPGLYDYIPTYAILPNPNPFSSFTITDHILLPKPNNDDNDSSNKNPFA